MKKVSSTTRFFGKQLNKHCQTKFVPETKIHATEKGKFVKTFQNFLQTLNYSDYEPFIDNIEHLTFRV